MTFAANSAFWNSRMVYDGLSCLFGNLARAQGLAAACCFWIGGMRMDSGFEQLVEAAKSLPRPLQRPLPNVKPGRDRRDRLEPINCAPFLWKGPPGPPGPALGVHVGRVVTPFEPAIW